jgi:YVTN family beta-propeller protein
MFRKIKLYVLIAACLVLFGCSRACDLYIDGRIDLTAFIYLVLAEFVYGIDPLTASAFPIPGTFTDLYSAYALYPNPNSLGYYGIASMSSKARFFVVSRSRGVVLVIDPNSDAVVATIPVGKGPTYGVVSPDNKWFFVSNTQENTISQINVANYTVSRTIQLASGTGPTYLAVSPDSLNLYDVNSTQNSVSAFSLSALGGKTTPAGTMPIPRAIATPIMTTPVGKNPTSMAIERGGSSLWVGNSGDNSVSLIDTLTMQNYKTITGVDTPTFISFKRDGSAALITNGTNNTLTVMKTLGYKAKTYSVGVNPSSVTSDTYGTNVYVTNHGSNSLTILNGTDYSLVKTISLAGPPVMALSLP